MDFMAPFSGRPPSGGPARRLLAAASLLLLAASPASAGGRGTPPPPALLDPALARCVLAELDRARSGAAVGLLYDACEALVGSGGDVAGGASADLSALLECRVPTGPDWARVRLLTRRQCAAAGGRPAAGR